MIKVSITPRVNINPRLTLVKLEDTRTIEEKEVMLEKINNIFNELSRMTKR